MKNKIMNLYHRISQFIRGYGWFQISDEAIKKLLDKIKEYEKSSRK